MPLSDYFEAALLNHVLRGVSYTAPATVYVALFTASPGDAGGGTEVAGGAYARVAISCSSAQWSAPTTAGLTDNVNGVVFAQATASWGTIAHVALFDAATGGNLLWYGALTSSQAVASGQTASFAAGTLDVSLD